MKKFLPLFFLLLTVFFPENVHAMRATSLDKNQANGGDVVAIRGTDLKAEGSESCTYYPPGSKTIVWGTCKFKLNVVAMKKEPARYCPRPLTYLPIISSTGSEMTVKIPTTMQYGAGDWYISLSGKYDNGDTFLVGGGELPIAISNVESGKYQCIQKDGTIIGNLVSPTPSPTIAPSSSSSPEQSEPALSPLPTDSRSDGGSSWSRINEGMSRVFMLPFHFLRKLFQMD